MLYPNKRDSIQLLIFAVVADLTTFFISGTSSTIAIFLGASGKNIVCRNHAGSGKARSAKVLLKRNSSGKASSDAGPGPCICDSKYVEDAKAARSVRVWDRVPIK